MEEALKIEDLSEIKLRVWKWLEWIDTQWFLKRSVFESEALKLYYALPYVDAYDRIRWMLQFLYYEYVDVLHDKPVKYRNPLSFVFGKLQPYEEPPRAILKSNPVVECLTVPYGSERLKYLRDLMYDTVEYFDSYEWLEVWYRMHEVMDYVDTRENLRRTEFEMKVLRCINGLMSATKEQRRYSVMETCVFLMYFYGDDITFVGPIKRIENWAEHAGKGMPIGVWRNRFSEKETLDCRWYY
jgi:hypothetical protein